MTGYGDYFREAIRSGKDWRDARNEAERRMLEQSQDIRGHGLDPNSTQDQQRGTT